MEKSTLAASLETTEVINGEKYESLEALIEPFIHLSLNALPDAVRKRVDEASFLYMFWNSRPDQRRPLAQRYDIQHDPAMEPENEYWLGLDDQVRQTESEKLKWELMAPQSITEADIKEKKLSALNAQLAALELQFAVPFADTTPVQDTATLAPVETVEQRRDRYLEWHTEEHRINPRGAVQRVFEREVQQNPKADRSNIGKDIRNARTKKTSAMGWTSQQVESGKRLT